MMSAVLFSAVDAVAAGAAGSAAALGASASAGAQKLRAMAAVSTAAVKRRVSVYSFMQSSSLSGQEAHAVPSRSISGPSIP